MNKYSSFNFNPTKIIKYTIVNDNCKELFIDNKYIINVSLLANKVIIKKSIEYLFDIKVIKINTKRSLKNKSKSKKYFKKAIITLNKGNKIKLFKKTQ